jgi:4-amino-4-deoxy-L-arabinose transferase-like glycosyltransferase
MTSINFNDKKYDIILSGIILFFVSTNLFWFSNDFAPPMWDQSHYLLTSEQLYHTLTSKGVFSFFTAYMDAMQTKAPLITVLPIPFYLIFGDAYSSALYVNLLFIIVGSIYLYKFVSLVSSKESALLSVLILNSFPLTFAMSREYLVEYGLMTFVIAWMYYILRLEITSSKKDAYVLGIVMGLGMLMKSSFILYIIFPTLFLIVMRTYELKKIPAEWKSNSLIIILSGAIVAGTWYFENLPKIVNFALYAGFSDVAKNWSMGDVFSLNTIFKYWVYFINYGVSFYYFALFAIVLFILFSKFAVSKKTIGRCLLDRKYQYFLLIWFIVPFLFFTFTVNKDYRYTLPVYPALAILMGMTIVKLTTNRYSRYIPVLLILFPLFNYIYISFSTRIYCYKWEPFILLGDYLAWAHAPRKEVWPNLQLVNLIHTDAIRGGKDNALTTFLFNHPYMNYLTSNYYAANRNLNIRFETIDYLKKDTIEDVIYKITNDADYLVTKSDKLGHDYSNTKNMQVKTLFDKGILPFGQIGTLSLPDNTVLKIHKKGFIQKPIVLLNFGPSKVEAGKGFNVQPNGESALWAHGEGVTASTIITINNVPLKGFPSGEKGMITTPVPANIYAKPGEYPLYLLDTNTGMKSKELKFIVKKNP